MVPARGREAVLGCDGFFPPRAALQRLVEPHSVCVRSWLSDDANIPQNLMMIEAALPSYP